MTDHKRPGVAFWATVGLVVVLVGYPLSFGPACWMVDRRLIPHDVTKFAYVPLMRVVQRCPISTQVAFIERTQMTSTKLGMDFWWTLDAE